MEFSVKLSALPAGFTVSEPMRERIRFDPARGELSYRGFMTKCAYDELSLLSDDPDYHRALEQLFVATSAEVAPPKKKLPAVIVMATAAAAVAAAALIWGALRHGDGERPAVPPATATVSTAS